ncbi:hypothetical protein EDB89DRAFT_75421 [Lactarius sanguifluus]|nr:hypothetical protein EDB89DRAFT_75421 [Lactarius sanguifluus]
MPSRLVSVCDSRLSDASQPHGGKFLSSDELLAFRQFFTRRADDVPLDARDFSTFPHLDQHPHDSVSLLCDDAASGLAEYGDSVQYHSSSHGHSDLRGTVGSPDSRSKQEDPLSALSVTRVESERVAPDNALPLAEGNPSGISLARLLNASSPTDAEYSHPEEMHDFLDLSPDIESPQPQQVTHEIPPLADVSRFLPGDESPVVVLEDAMAGPSGGRNPKRSRGDRADPVLAESPTSSTRYTPRRVQSAAELASGPRIPTQALPARAAAAFCADVTSRGHARRGYDASTGPVTGYEGGHAYSRSAVEPSDLWRRDSHYNSPGKKVRSSNGTGCGAACLVQFPTAACVLGCRIPYSVTVTPQSIPDLR